MRSSLGRSGAMALTLAAGLAAAARAETPPTPYAGLVVQMADGTVHRFCLSLDGDGTTGEQLLRQSGLPLVADATPLGAQVCRIGDDGCAWPAESCWCRCRVLTGDCRYWAYSTLEDGAWRYALLGASAREVRPGDVDGWAWGAGSLIGGAAPPVIPFATICRAELAAAGRAAPPSSGAPPTATGPAGANPTGTEATPATDGSGSTATPPAHRPATPPDRLGAQGPEPATKEVAATARPRDAGSAAVGGGAADETAQTGAGRAGAQAGGAAGAVGGLAPDADRAGAAGAAEAGAGGGAGGAGDGLDASAGRAARGTRPVAGAGNGANDAAGGAAALARGAEAPTAAARGMPVTGLVAFAAVGGALLVVLAWAWRRGSR